MINQLYQVVNKGSYRALSFILAILLMLSIFFNAQKFALELGGPSPLFTLFLILGTSVLWIHGIGLNIKKNFWKAVFNPFIGYFAALAGLYYIYLS
ncbi:cyd operon protein YbgE [Pasteurella testudinis DSM 23072]|uniref:Cyd operon protein YbgE n=1 Tax=Pasteurella testudinis DSM 23072 TaxID=1122938 RepID=A0A1W1UMH2_9PAST|nr:cyd operon YbgE family protein [Pasteurella testudinis]SMB82223.1 cyd operon protein YbgE [Pasteurella testudinis DSM 23072]SUB52332.1 cyd operon protein YbgE [Pasteurella testudinis]